MQQAISYVVARLANVADVDSTNVETSLRERAVRMRDVALRPAPLNALLPVPIASGHITALRVELPWPTSSEPLRVHLAGALAVLLPHAAGGGEGGEGGGELSAEEIRRAATDEAILGPRARAREAEPPTDSAAAGEPPAECGAARGASRAASEVDDEDYLSCRSEGETSLASSFAGHSESAAPAPPEESTGLLAFVSNVAAKSVSWIMRRPIEVVVENLTVKLPCDPEGISCIEVNVQKLTVHVEPLKDSGAERMKITSANIDGVSVSAQLTEVRKDVVQVENCGLRITSVYGLYDRLCRENTVVELGGAVLLLMEEETLQALACCITNYGNMTSIPKYCRPFLSLRSHKSWWPYTLNSVLALIRDRKKRFNFNPSHLHFYAEARNSYIRLLNYVHCTKDVSEKRESLAEVEKDLRYRDVVMFLREHVLRKYTSQSTASEALQPKIAYQVEGNDNIPARSFHFDVKAIQISFSALMKMWIRDVSFVSRFGEKHFSVRSLSVDNGGELQNLCGPCETQDLIVVDVLVKNNMHFLTIRVEELRLALQSALLRRMVEFFAEMALFILPVLAPLFCKSISSPSNASAHTSRTVSLVFPFVQVSIDDLTFTIEKLSLNNIERDGAVRRWGLLLKEFSVRYANDHDVIPPMHIGMTSNDDIICSKVLVYISNTLWDYLYRQRLEWESVTMLLQKIWMTVEEEKKKAKIVKGSQALAPNASLPTFDAMENLSLMKYSFRSYPKYQRMQLTGITCNFFPLQAKIDIQSLEVSRVICENQQSAIRVGISLFYASTSFVDGVTFTATLPKGLYCLLPTSTNQDTRKVMVSIDLYDCTWTTTLKTMMITTERKETFSLLKGSHGKLVIYGGTMYGVSDSVLVLDAVEMAPVRIMYRSHPVQTPTTLRPYRASFIQVYVNLVRVYVERLAHLSLRPLIAFSKQCEAVIARQVVFQHAYRLFFSGLSDIAFVVAAMPCELVFGDAGTICLQVKMPFESGKEVLLESFGVFLPEMEQFGPLLVQNICETLHVEITLPILELEAFHSSFPLINLRMVIRSLSSVLPMRMQSFWESAVCSMQKSVVDADIKNMTLSLNDDLAIVERISLVYDVCTANSSSGGGEDDACGGCEERRIRANTFMDSDAESDVSSARSAEETAHVEAGAWNIYFRALADAARLHSLVMLYSELRFMFSSVFKKYLVISDSVLEQNFILSESGPCFFDRPGGVILVEGCSFVGSSLSTSRLVVCRETYVCFRRCRFSSSLQDAVCTEDKSGFFVIEEDCAEVAPIAEVDVSSLPKTEDGRRHLRWIRLNLQQGNVHLILGDKHSSRALLSLPSIDLHMRSASLKYKMQLRIQRIRCDIIQGGVISYLFTRTDIDADLGMNMKKKHATLNAALRIASVSVPHTLIELVRSIKNNFNEVFLSGETTHGRVYQPPPASSKWLGLFSVKWKAFISSSVIPLEFRLLNGIPFAKLLISNMAIWSKSTSTGNAFLEAKMGLQEFDVWEFFLQRHVPFLQKPLSAVVVLGAKDFTSLSCDISLSSCELLLSSNQLKCMVSICSALCPEEDMVLGSKESSKQASSVNLINLTGAPLIIRVSSSEEVELHNYLSLQRQMSSFPHCVQKINRKNVVHFENSSLPFFDDSQSKTLLHAAYIAILEDGERIHIATQVKEGSLMLAVTFRSVFHIMNSIPCCVEFYSKKRNVLVTAIEPGELSCIPLAFMDSKDIVMCLKDTDTDAISDVEPLGEGSARSLLKAAQCYGEEAISNLKTFAFTAVDKLCYVDVVYRLVDSILIMILAPATPVIRNGTRFPLKVRLFLSGKLKEENTIHPNELFRRISYNSSDSHLQFSFECVTLGETFLSNEKTALGSQYSNDDESLVMKHSKYPGLYFFELSVERDSPRLTVPHPFYTVRPRHVFGIENNTFLDIEFTSENDDCVGSLGGKVLSSSPGQNFAYFPFKTPLIIRVGNFCSSPFEVTETSTEGKLIVCDVNSSNESFGSSQCFVLRPIEGCGDGYNMELVPSVFFVNMCKSRNLLVKHTIQPKGSCGDSSDDGNDKWIHHDVVLANDRLPYTFLSRYGFSDFLSFSWECENSDEPEYSTPVEVTMSFKIDWTGFIQCGETHHVLHIHRKGLGEPVVLIVGPPRPPYVALVNLTPLAFDTLSSMAMLSYTPPSVNNDEVVLSFSEEKDLKISINQNSCIALKTGVSVFVQSHRDSVTIVLVHIPLESTSFSHIKKLNGIISQKLFETESVLFSSMSSWRVDLKFSGFSFVIRDTAENAILLGLESGELWLVGQSPKITAQCTMSNAYIQSTYLGKTSHIVKPFCVDMGVRDLERMSNLVHIQSAQINVTRLVLEVSDVFLYQLQQLYKCCEFLTTNTQKNSLSVWNKISTPMVKHKRLKIEYSEICEIGIVLTWDRSVTPPEDVVFRGSTIGSFIPSLHSAKMKLPTMQFRELSCNSVEEAIAVVREVLPMEILRRLPHLVSSAIYFTSISSFGTLLSRLGSFILDKKNDSSDTTSSTPI